MRLSAARVGQPDRSRTRQGQGRRPRRSLDPRVGYPVRIQRERPEPEEEGFDPIHQEFDAHTTFSYEHGLGYEPDVTVLDSNDKEVEVSVVHVDTSNVSIYFNGQLAGTLILN